MKKLSLALLCLGTLPLLAVQLLKEKDIYVLENTRLRAEISPARGGRVIRLYDKKTRQELTNNFSAVEAPSGSGLFVERLWPSKGRQFRHYESTAYKVVSSRADKNAAELALRCNSRPLDIEKTYVLRENERRLLVRYSLSNPGEKAFTGRFWCCTVITPRGENWHIQLPEGFSGASHNKKGPLKLNVVRHNTRVPRADNHWSIQPRQDFGSVSTAGASGAALVAPYELLDLFYSSVPGSGAPNQPTLEWLTFPLQIKPLAVGKADAVNHPELEDPLQDYIVRFTTAIEVFDKIDPKNYRPRPTVKKSTRFRPVLTTARSYKDFVRPAVPWFANQKENPRVISFAHYNVAAEAFEFFRRFKCDYDVLEGWSMLGPGSVNYCGYNLPDPVPYAEKVLKGKVDAFILPGFVGQRLPAGFKKQLISKVKAGAVAVYVSDVNRFKELFPRRGGKAVPPEIFRGLPFKRDIREFKVGRGKVFFVPFRLHLNNRFWSKHRVMLPAPEKEPVDHEHIFAMYGRLLRYGLGYKSSALISSVKVQPGKAVLQVKAQKDCSASVNGKKYQLKKGMNSLVYSFVPQKLNGRYDLPLLLDVDGFRTDIFAASYEVKKLPAVKHFASAKYAHESGEAVRGSFEIGGKGNVKILLRDAEGRVIGSYSKQNVSGKHTFAVKAQMNGVNSLCFLEMELSNGKTVTEKRSCTVTRRTPDDSKLRFVLWHQSNTSPAIRVRHLMAREIGFTHLLGSQGHATGPLDARLGAEAICRTGGRYVVNTLHRFFQPNVAKEKKFRSPCLRDPAGLARIRKKVREIAGKHVQNFPVLYTSADENSLGWHDAPHDFCFSKHCLAGFRKAMAQKYKTLAALNKAWKTSFKSWDKVTPFTVAQAKKSGNYASVLAHRNYMTGALENGLSALEDELRKLDPQARLSHSGQGLTRFNDGWDWSKMLPHYSMSSLYATMGGLPDFIRTVRPGYPAGNWNGYGAPLPQIRFTAWNDITDGLFAPAYWYDVYFYRRGDNRLNEAGLHMKKVISEIRESGADPLMTSGKRVKSPFTLVYSPAGLYAAAATGHNSIINAGIYSGNLVGWVRLLRSAGYPAPQIIDEALLEQVTVKNTRVLVLPLFQQMSNAQIATVQRFVRAGGILVIDAQAGVIDDLYTFRKVNPLLKMAGVKVPLAQGASGGAVMFGELPVRVMPTGAKAESAGAGALGSVTVNSPGARWGTLELGEVKRTVSGAFFSNRYGKGKVLYINGLMHGVPSALSDGALAGPLCQAFRRYFASAGVKAAASAAADVNHSEYLYKGYRTLAVTRRNGSGTEKFVYPLGKKYHIYDVLTHKYLGCADKVTWALAAWDVKMTVMTSRKVSAPALKFSKTPRGIAVVSHSDSGVWSARLFCRGKELMSLRKNVVLDKNGKAFFDFGLSPEGVCEVRLHNVMTGKKVQYKADFK